MKHFVLLAALTLISLTTAVQAKTLSRVAAVVNNEVISTHQLDQAVMEALSRKNNTNQLSAAQFDQLKETLLEQLINDKLLEQRAAELNIDVENLELENAINDVQAKNGLSRETLIQALAAQGMTLDSYRVQVRKEILRYKLINREVRYKVLVTSGEVRDYFREHIDEYRVQPKVRVSRISFPIPPGASSQRRDELEAEVDTVRAQLLAGEPFDEVLAAQDNANGDDMGAMVETDMAAPLQEAIRGLDKGDVSEVIELNGQLHLFLVTDRNPGDVNLFDRVKGEIEEKLRDQKTDARFDEWQRELRTNAFIEKRL